MSYTNELGLWSLVLGRYAAALHVTRHVEEGSLVRKAKMEVAFFEGLALDHFGLQEALAAVKEHVMEAADFPP